MKLSKKMMTLFNLRQAGSLVLTILLAFSAASCFNPSAEEPPAASIQKQAGLPDQVVPKTDAAPINPILYELVMDEMVKSVKKWNGLDYAYKQKAVEGFIQLIKRRENATISKSSDFYVKQVDEMLGKNPDFPQNLPTLIKFLAVMAYDFENGQDKDVLAQEILGPSLYAANKTRHEMEKKTT